jgi:hypothetical protein
VESAELDSLFQRYIGIDYSGAKTPAASLKGLRVYVAGRHSPPREVQPAPRRYWTRRDLAQWIVERLREPNPTIVGIDNAFSFPLQYFERHRIRPDWTAFLEDFQKHWPTDGPDVSVESLRNGNARSGDPRWRRLTETRCRAKSVFHFDVNGSVAKSTHAGIPWLRYIRCHAGERAHFWPFDGWAIPGGKSVVAEIYPALWNKNFPRHDRDPHQHDAFCVAEMLRRLDLDETIRRCLEPKLDPEQRRVASVEGWILGIVF